MMLTRGEVAARLGVRVKSVDKMRQRTHDGLARVPFPEPTTVQYGKPLWSVQVIDRFARTRYGLHKQVKGG
jgi:hypothetical protein